MTITRATRPVTDEEFEQALIQWRPKLAKFANSWSPYVEDEDRLQEAKLVLLKCLSKFEEGRGAIFHTYFHTALRNRLGELMNRPRKHNEDPNNVTYLSEIEEAFEEDTGRQTNMGAYKALQVSFDPNLEFEAASWGFVGLEIPYMMGLAHQITLAETASQFGVDLEGLKQAAKTAREKIQQLRGGQRD